VNIVYKIVISCHFLLLIAYPQSQSIKFERISVEQGLSKSEVTCILQDTQDFLWFGSTLGLKKFDGNKFISFLHDPNKPGSISSNIVSAITEDRFGSLWVGTLFGGLNRFDKETEKFIHYGVVGDSLPKDRKIYIYDILEDQSGKLWVGTNIGLCYFNREASAVKRYFPKPSDRFRLINCHVHVLYEDRKGRIWIGTKYNGLFMFDPEIESVIQYQNDPRVNNSLSNNRIESIIEDNSGNLFIGTRNGLNKFNRKRNNFIRYFYQPLVSKIGEQNWIRTLCPANSNILWIASSEGLFKFNNSNDTFINIFHNSNENDDLKNHSIKKLYKDHKGILWIGTYVGDIFKYDPNKMKFLQYISDTKDPFGLSNNFIHGICEDSEGNLWVGTNGGGLYELKANQLKSSSPKWIHHKYDPENSQSLSHNKVFCIYEDHKRNIWIGTGSGVNIFVPSKMYRSNAVNQKTGLSFRDNIPNSLQKIRYHYIYCIYEDKHNNIWMGTNWGLYKFNRITESLVHYVGDSDNPGTLGKKPVTCIIESKNGLLWIGTYYYGFYKFDPEKEEFARYCIDPENPYSDWIFMIYEDRMGFLWIASKRGLYKFNPGTNNFVPYKRTFGLPDDDIYAILDDREGNFWLSSVKGIFRFSPGSGVAKAFDTADGLHSMEFNIYSYHKGKSGWLYFGGINGFTAFHPDSIKYNDQIPNIVLTDFQIFNKTISPGSDSPLKKTISETREIILPYDQSVFTFEFAALDYTNPEKNKYAYIMEGVDPDWVYTDASRRFATYTQLDPGEYTFRVKGSNNDGIWNETGTSIKIIISPPWWQSKWAYFFYILVIASVVISIWRFQINRLRMKHQLEIEHLHAEKLQEVDQIKSRFFANISHEFRTPLTLIQGPIKQMLSDEFKGNIKEQYRMILSYSDRLLKLINQILDLSKLESGRMALKVRYTNVTRFLKGIIQSFASLAERKKISLKMKVDNESVMGYVDKEKLEMIVTNLLSNAFKFTPECGMIEANIDFVFPAIMPEGGRADCRKEGINGIPDHFRDENKQFIKITIKNTGPGIPPEKLDKIFDRFYQVDNSYTKDSDGTGIGLALTKELVETHHGEIQVESKLNKDTTFKVWLPIEKDHFKPEEVIDETLVQGDVISQIHSDEMIKEKPEPAFKTKLQTSKSVPLLLIVEDNPDVTTYISSFLENDYRIITAENGQTGWKIALEKFPDLIISDVMMPVMDGFEYCQKIKSDQRTSHIPLILLTAKADIESKLEGLEFGADDYVTKPFDAKELSIRSKNLLLQRSRLREHFQREVDFHPSDITVNSIDEKFMEKAIELIEQNMDNTDFNVERFAQEIGMSSRNLSRKLHAITNYSTQDFIRIMRLKRAAQLLQKKSDPVTQVAYQVGFSNPAYFAQCFRRQFGMSPSEYTTRHS